MRNWKTLVILGAGVAGACAVGSVVVTGTVGGRTINPQTVFAYLIDKQYEATDNGRIVLVPLPPEQQVLVIQLDGAAYDPNQDLRFLSVDDKLRIAQEQAINGSLQFTIGAAGKLGGTLDTSTDVARTFVPFNEPPPTDPQILTFTYAFAQSEIESPDLPQKLPVLGSKRKFSVKLDKIGKQSGDVTEGTVILDFKRSDNPDPADALQGTLEMKVKAEHVGQRVGQCNPSPQEIASGLMNHGQSFGFGDSFGSYPDCEDFD